MDDSTDWAAQAKRGSPYLTTQQAAYYLGVSTSYLESLRSHGKGPVYRRHSHRIHYHIDDIRAWSDAQAQGGRP